MSSTVKNVLLSSELYDRFEIEGFGRFLCRSIIGHFETPVTDKDIVAVTEQILREQKLAVPALTTTADVILCWVAILMYMPIRSHYTKAVLFKHWTTVVQDLGTPEKWSEPPVPEGSAPAGDRSVKELIVDGITAHLSSVCYIYEPTANVIMELLKTYTDTHSHEFESQTEELICKVVNVLDECTQSRFTQH